MHICTQTLLHIISLSLSLSLFLSLFFSLTEKAFFQKTAPLKVQSLQRLQILLDCCFVPWTDSSQKTILCLIQLAMIIYVWAYYITVKTVWDDYIEEIITIEFCVRIFIYVLQL
jgi:hypothetical protein